MIDVSSYFVGFTKGTKDLLFKYGGGGLYSELDKNEIKGIFFSFQYIKGKQFGRIILYTNDINCIPSLNEITTQGNKLFFDLPEETQKYIKLNSYTIPVINKSVLDSIKNIEGIKIYKSNNGLFQLYPNVTESIQPEDLNEFPVLRIQNEYEFTKQYCEGVIKILSGKVMKQSGRDYAQLQFFSEYLSWIEKEYQLFNKDIIINLNYFNTKRNPDLTNLSFYQRISQLFSVFGEYGNNITNLVSILSKEQNIIEEEPYKFILSEEKMKFIQKLHFPKFTINDLDSFHFKY